jgi:hypothetical protein
LKDQIVKAALLALSVFPVGALNAQIPATGLCNTGLTPASPPPEGCATSVPVSPLNPPTGGPSVDGNWKLASPYPSASYTRSAPNPCALASFGPAWVDQPTPVWLIPNDGLSQWISPMNRGNTLGGWYVYATGFATPSSSSVAKYRLTVVGGALADDAVPAIFLSNELRCRVVALPSLGTGPTLYPANLLSFTPFAFEETVASNSTAYLYVLVFNVDSSQGTNGNSSGLLVEFTSAYFTPE